MEVPRPQLHLASPLHPHLPLPLRSEKNPPPLPGWICRCQYFFFFFNVTKGVDKLIIPISYIFDIRQSEMKWTKRTEVKKNANSTKGDFLPIETLVPYQPANFELILSGIASSRSGFATKIGGWQNELLPSFCISPFSLS